MSAMNVASFSVEGWINVPSGTPCGTGGGLFSITSGTLAVTLDCVGSTDFMSFSISDGTSTAMITATVSAVDTGTWHHVVGSWATGGGSHAPSLYVDGADATPSGTTSPAPVTAQIYPAGATLRAGFSPSYLPAGSSLAHIAIYSSALTLSQAQSHYQAAGYSLGPPP
jgi:hypothetical protein